MAENDLGRQIVAALIAKQKRRADKSDRSFAEHLGVSRPLWQKTRAGDIPLARAIALAVIDLYADLRPQATAFLLTPRANGNALDDNGNAAGAVANALSDNDNHIPVAVSR